MLRRLIDWLVPDEALAIREAMTVGDVRRAHRLWLVEARPWWVRS